MKLRKQNMLRVRVTVVFSSSIQIHKLKMRILRIFKSS